MLAENKAEVYSIPGLEARSRESATAMGALGENSFFASFGFRWLQALLGLWPHQSSLYSMVLCSHGSLLPWFPAPIVLCSHGSLLSWFFAPMVPCSHGSLLHGSLLLLFSVSSYKGTCHWMEGPPGQTRIISPHLNILNLIASAKTFSKAKITFAGSGD